MSNKSSETTHKSKNTNHATHHEHSHEYLHEHNIPHEHHDHHTPHVHENKKAVINRISKAIGHLESIKKMVEDDRDCSEVLIQLSAVKSAINNTGKVILKDHLDHCIVDAIEHDDYAELEQFKQAIEQFIK